ncbi:MAG: MFS transporter [Propionibacteriaceae bacterium]|jgi:UMF1 family MFS transporter|nr:MFS transporter [Propionibacteriaceae bacterium]
MSQTTAPTAKKRGVFAWALWDWGTQPYYTVVTTFVFAVYLTGSAFAGDGDPNWPSRAWAIATIVGSVVIAVLAPVLGQSGDRTGHTVRDLRFMTWAIAGITAALYFVAPDPAYLLLGLALFTLGTIIGEIASVNYNALIDRVSDEKNFGKVSGFGWGMGYIGGILVLLVILVVFILPEQAPFGIETSDMRVRAAMVLCGVWTLIFTIPIFVRVKDRAPLAAAPRVGVVESYKQVFATIRRLWGTQRHTVYFLIASAVYRDGLAGVFSFGAIIAATSYGFTTTEIIYFGAAANLIAGLVTMAFGLLDDKIGPKIVILICLGTLVVSELVIFFAHQPGFALHDGDAGYDAAVAGQGHLLFWVVGLVASSVCGPAQAAGRSFLARNIPEGHSGEIFGLYATTGRAVSFLSPLLVLITISIGSAVVGGQAAAQHWAAIGLALLLVVGAGLLLPVKERRSLD